MLFETSLVSYDSIKINNEEITLDGNYRVSFSPPYNKVDINFSLLESSLSYYEVRVTGEDDPYGVGEGILALNPNEEPLALFSLALNKSHAISISVCPKVFNKGDGVYRVGLYAKSAVDGIWDITYFLFTLSDGYVYTSDGELIGVCTTQESPSIA
jgi:hypothetical protein